MRRWETARETKLLTKEQKEMLKDVNRRFSLEVGADERLLLIERNKQR